MKNDKTCIAIKIGFKPVSNADSEYYLECIYCGVSHSPPGV